MGQGRQAAWRSWDIQRIRRFQKTFRKNHTLDLGNRNRDTEVENKCMDTKRGKGEWDELETGIDKYTLSILYTAKSLQLCLTLCDSMDCSPPGSSVNGILQEEYWHGLPFLSPGHLPNSGIEPVSLIVSCIGRRVLYH